MFCGSFVIAEGRSVALSGATDKGSPPYIFMKTKNKLNLSFFKDRRIEIPFSSFEDLKTAHHIISRTSLFPSGASAGPNHWGEPMASTARLRLAPVSRPTQ